MEKTVSQEQKKERTKGKGNSTLYLFQGIACLLVVLIHIPFPGVVGVFFDSVARIAVPLFFMISGYTLYRHLETEKYKKKVSSRIKKNAWVTVGAILVYLIIDIVRCILMKEGVGDYLLGVIQPDKLVLMLFVGIIPVSSGTLLWFIYGLVYVYIILYFFPPKKKNVYRNAIISLIITTIFTAGKIFFTANPVSIGGFDLSTYWIYGNWAVIGLTTVTMGMAVAKFIEEFPQKVQVIRKHAWWIALVCIVLNFGLIYLLNQSYGMYLSYTLFTIGLDFLIFAYSTEDKISSTNFLSVLGQKHSRNVYLWHYIFVMAIGFIAEFLGLQNSSVFAWFAPILVIVATVVFSIVTKWLFGYITKKLKEDK